MDLAISGDGFFVSNDGTGIALTREGAFLLDRSGNVFNSLGQILQGLVADGTGTLGQVTTDIQLNTSSSSPNATTSVSIGVNLDAESVAPTQAYFATGATDTFNNHSSTTVYDSLGNAHTLTTQYIKADPATAVDDKQCYVAIQIDGNYLYSLAEGTSNLAVFPKIDFNDDGSFNAITVLEKVPKAVADGVKFTGTFV